MNLAQNFLVQSDKLVTGLLWLLSLVLYGEASILVVHLQSPIPWAW